MTDELVWKPELGVDHLVLAHQDEVVEATPGAEPELVHHLQVTHEAEGARRRDPRPVLRGVIEGEVVALLPHRRRVTQQVGHGERVRGFDGQRPVPVPDLIDAVDDDLLAGSGLIHDADLVQVVAELQGRPVEHGDLAVDLDQEVTDPVGVERRQEMLHGADAVAAAGEGGGIVGLRHRRDVGRNLGPPRQRQEVDPAVGWQGLHHHPGAHARMQPEPVHHGAGADGALRPIGGLEQWQPRGLLVGAVARGLREAVGVQVTGPPAQGAFHRIDGLIVGERFLQVVVGAHLDGLHGRRRRAVPGHHDDRHPRVQLAQRLQGLETVAVRQPDVQEHHVRMLTAVELDRLLAAGGGQGAVPLVAQNARQRREDSGLVVHDQDQLVHGVRVCSVGRQRSSRRLRLCRTRPTGRPRDPITARNRMQTLAGG